MALTGVHISCGFVGGTGKNGLTLAAMRKPAWSQTMLSAGTTTNVAPTGSQSDGDPYFEVTPSINIFVAVGPNPDAVNGPRLYVHHVDDVSKGGQGMFGDPGDKLAWVAA